MLCKLILFFALLLAVLEPLLGHPLDTYARPVLVEEEQVVSPEDRSYLEQAYLDYPSLITRDISSDGLRTAGFVPSQAVKEELQNFVHHSRELYGPTKLRYSSKNLCVLQKKVIHIRDGKRVLLGKPLLNPLSRFLGNRKQYRKRGSNTECFWKYCV